MAQVIFFSLWIHFSCAIYLPAMTSTLDCILGWLHWKGLKLIIARCLDINLDFSCFDVDLVKAIPCMIIIYSFIHPRNKRRACIRFLFSKVRNGDHADKTITVSFMYSFSNYTSAWSGCMHAWSALINNDECLIQNTSDIISVLSARVVFFLVFVTTINHMITWLACGHSYTVIDLNSWLCSFW